MPADFASSVDDPSPMQIPGSIKGGPGLVLSHSTVMAPPNCPRAYDHLALITDCRTVANLARTVPGPTPSSAA
jgi:hypothetical protein